MHSCISLEYMYMWRFESTILEFTCFSSRGGQSSLIRWWMSLILSLNDIFSACLLCGVVQIASRSWIFLQWATSTCKKNACLLISKLTIRIKSFWSIVLLHIKAKSSKTCTHLFSKTIRIIMPSEKPGWWC